MATIFENQTGMKKYKGAKESGVSEYEIGPDWIRVQFKDGTVYTYSYESAGRIHVETMKDLAVSGKFLSTYISKYVRDNYVPM
jgi:hypothetical protein